MCYEGGCGSCVVCVQIKDPVTHKDVLYAVNSVSYSHSASFKSNFNGTFFSQDEKKNI